MLSVTIKRGICLHIYILSVAVDEGENLSIDIVCDDRLVIKVDRYILSTTIY